MRKAPLKRGKPLRRVVVMEGAKHPRPKRVRDERRVIWNRAIRGERCNACGVRPATEAHHIIKEQVLRRYAVINGYDFEEVRFDRRNRLGLCKDCHSGHHSRARPLTRDLLERRAPDVFGFAVAVQLTHILDREYPCPPR